MEFATPVGTILLDLAKFICKSSIKVLQELCGKAARNGRYHNVDQRIA